jgi:protein TonB
MKSKNDLKTSQPLVLRLALVGILVILIILLLAFPKVKKNEVVMRTPPIIITTVTPPIVDNPTEPSKPPARPSLPLPSDEPDLSPDITLEPVNFGSYQPWDAPPPLPPEAGILRDTFIVYDKDPEPIGGYAAIQKNIIYPAIAQEAGIEGTVVIRAFVDKRGEVTECSVLKGMPNTGLEEAAIDAIRKVRFIPAQQRDRNVGVYIAIPVIFRLRN